jgi:ABC-type antimicrobial peptide transport system permease subunit
MDDIVGHARSRPRLYTALTSVFAALTSVFAASALVIAAIGTFGVVAYVVALGRREIGIRMALGATPARVEGEFVMQASWRTAIGLLIGLGAATALARYLESMLFGVGARDPWSFAAAAVNPVEVLRTD